MPTLGDPEPVGSRMGIRQFGQDRNVAGSHREASTERGVGEARSGRAYIDFPGGSAPQ